MKLGDLTVHRENKCTEKPKQPPYLPQFDPLGQSAAVVRMSAKFGLLKQKYKYLTHSEVAGVFGILKILQDYWFLLAIWMEINLLQPISYLSNFCVILK